MLDLCMLSYIGQVWGYIVLFKILWCFLIHTFAVCLPQGAGTHPLYSFIAFLSAEIGETNSFKMIDLWLHLTHSHIFPGADAATVMMKGWRTGRGRWGSHVAPPTLLTALLWQWQMAFPCVCNSFPQELQVFYYSVTFLQFIYHHWLCHWSTDLGVGDTASVEKKATDCQRQGEL